MDTVLTPPLPLGQVLLAERLITQEMLDEALAEQRHCGCRLGTVLTGQGRITYLKLYQTLAKHHHRPFVDLVITPPSLTLLSRDDRALYLRDNAIPWKQEGGKTILAVTDISHPPAWAKERYGENIDYVITSPWDIAWTVQSHFSKEDDFDARERLWQHHPEASAKTLLAGIKRPGVALVFLSLLVAALAIPNGMTTCFIALNFFYATILVFKLLLFLTGTKERHVTHPPLLEQDLPIYTILVPLFQEDKVVAQLVDAIRQLDYPKSKLDVKLIIESGDTQTRNAIKTLQCESYFEIVPVPFSLPQTKPKACNYALRFAKGKFITIYDAEDKPNPSQLRQVVAAFETTPPHVACIQAKLNYYNRKANLLTRMFALEYGTWFEYLLKGLEALNMPIPLGGTSNHMRRDVLEQIHAWDPYNVTEDADLGVRLAAYGYTTQLVDALTVEEAPMCLMAWIKQRSRWIKGYMQTYLVHMRNPVKLRKTLGMRGYIGFQLFIGAPCLVYLISPFIWLTWAVAWLGYIPLPELIGIKALMAFNLGFGLALQIGIAAIVAIQLGWWETLPYALAFPFYWILHSVASFRALWQLFTRPHYWEKTVHGQYSVDSGL